MDLKAFNQLSCGHYLISSAYEGKESGCIVNTVQQVTAEPAQLAVTINKNSYTGELIAQSGMFEGTVLSKDVALEQIGRFGFQSGRDTEKFKGISCLRDEEGIPYVKEGMTARFFCRVTGQMDVGTHRIFVGKVEQAQCMEGESMTYAYYHQVKKGGTPKEAPSYQGEEKGQPAQKGWRCKICGYVFEGEALPPDFVCPICKKGPEYMEPLAE